MPGKSEPPNLSTLIHDHPLLGRLSTDNQAWLAGQVQDKELDTGAVMGMPGEIDPTLFLLVKGTIRLALISEGGAEQVLCLMSPGSCYGLCPLFYNSSLPVMAQAVTPVRVAIISDQVLAELGERQPSWLIHFLKFSTSRYQVHLQLMSVLSFGSAREKIAYTLLHLAGSGGDTGRVTGVTHETLASMAGTSREVVSRNISSLRQEGALITHGHSDIEINRDALIRAAGKLKGLVQS